MSAAKNWCFTLNNYTETQRDVLENVYSSGTISYIVFGLEVGEEGTPHIQGFVQFKKKLRMNQVKQQLGVGGTVHLEVMRGNAQQASDYCKKEGNFSTYGQIVSMGMWGLHYFQIILD